MKNKQHELLARCQDPQRPRILITRLSAIGDSILTLPLLCALRQSLPDSYLGWLTEPGAAQLLEGHAALDELIVVRKRWLKSLRGWYQIYRLRKARFDVVIDPQGLTKSAIIAWLAGVPMRIGFAAPRAREASSMWYTHRVAPRATHIVDSQLELLGPLGITPRRVEFGLPDYYQEMQRMDHFLAGAFGGDAFVVIHPGASWPSRRWPPDRFAQVARHLWHSHRLMSLVVWGNDPERQWAEEIVAENCGHSRLAPSTTLRELACLLRRAAFVVAGDSGPLHIAVAAGTPVVGLFGPTDARQTGPYGMRHRVVQSPVAVPTRLRRTSPAAMEAIAVETVCAACDDVWQQCLSYGESGEKIVDRSGGISTMVHEAGEDR